MKRTPSTDAQATVVDQFAARGHNDPTIAATLGCTVSHVRALRKEYGIAPGETRWLSHHDHRNTRFAAEPAEEQPLE